MTPEELRGARIAEAIRLRAVEEVDNYGLLDILANLYETNWTPPEPVDLDLLAAREWVRCEWKSPIHNRHIDSGAHDTHQSVRAYLAGCTRGREGAKGLVEALQSAVSWIEGLPMKGASHQLMDHILDGYRDALRKAALASAKRGG